jgi:hypothetical protein
MSPTIQPSVEPEQGAVKQQEALEQMVPIQNEIAPTNPQQMAEQAVQTAAPPQQPASAPANPMLRLPPEVVFAPLRSSSTPVQRQYNVGLLWKVLADQSDDPTTRAVASALLGR